MPRVLVCLVSIVVVACGGAPVTDRPQAAASAPPVPLVGAVASASTMHPPDSEKVSRCLAPWKAATGDPRVDAMSIAPDELAEIDHDNTDPIERLFRIGQLFFERHDWVDAALRFRRIAFLEPEPEEGIYATLLYLESLNTLGTGAARPECYEAIARELPLLRSIHCGDHRKDHVEECNLLADVQKTLSRVGERFDLSSPDDARLERERQVAFFLKECQPASVELKCDEMGLASALGALANGDAKTAERIKAIMVNPKNGMSKSPLTAKVVCRLSSNAAACP